MIIINNKIDVECSRCGTLFPISYYYYKNKSKDPNYKSFCNSCLKILRSEVRTNFWKNASKKERNKIFKKLNSEEAQKKKSKSLLIYNANRSKKSKKLWINKLKNTWKNKSEEEKNRIKNLNKEAHKKWWNNLSIEKKENKQKKHKEWYHRQSEEYKINNTKMLKNESIKFWDSPDSLEMKQYHSKELTERNIENWKNKEYREKISKNNRDRWRNMSYEEKILWHKNHVESMANSDGFKGSTEYDFMNDLNKYHIKYEDGYPSKIIHPDFNNIFDNDYINNGDISPYHAWDFLIYTKQGNILIDIDGSEHDIIPGKFITDNKDVGAYIQFNDSKRPYQTDNMNAYIIEAYEDKLEDNIPVYCLSSNTYINYKELISLINLMNINMKNI